MVQNLYSTAGWQSSLTQPPTWLLLRRMSRNSSSVDSVLGPPCFRKRDMAAAIGGLKRSASQLLSLQYKRDQYNRGGGPGRFGG